MSLINDVLRDLDRRHANSNERAGIPHDVRPLPSATTKGAFGWLVMIGGVAVVLCSGLFWGGGSLRGNDVIKRDIPAVVSTAATELATTKLAPATQPLVTDTAPAPAPSSASPVLPPAAVSQAAPSQPSQSKTKLAGIDEKSRLNHQDVRLKLDPQIKVAEVKDPNAAGQSPNGVLTPAQPDNWAKAQSLLRSGRNEEAEIVLRKLVEMQPALLAPRQSLLGILLPARRYADAIPLLVSGLAQHPDQTAWAMNLARLHIDAGNYEKAWEALSVALPHAQQQAEYLAFAGTILQRLERPAEAAAQYQAALRLRADESRWWVGLGISLDASGHPAEARAAYLRAKAIGNFSPEIGKFIEQKLQ